MQVNVFVARKDGQLQRELLVLPMLPQAAIPAEYRSGWTYYATVDIGDRMLGELGAVEIEAELAKSGFVMVTPAAPDRR